MWGDWDYYYGGGPHWGHPLHWFFPLLMLMIVFFVLRMISYRWGWRRGWHGPWGHWHGHGPGDSALEILRQRYARGEITKADFDRMQKDLGY